jgi:Na+-driven multidrug efflux pump
MIIACVANIIGDYVLVGMLGMKSAGAALATVGTQGLSVIFAAFIIYKRGFCFDAKKEDLRLTKKETMQILKFGVPIAAQDALTGVSFMAILAILNGFGVVASAGIGIAKKLCALMFIVPSSMNAAIPAFSAQNIGAGKKQRARFSMYYGILVSEIVGCIMFLTTFFHGDVLTLFFTNNPEVIAAAADYLRSYSVDCILVGISFCMMGYLNGCGKTFFVSLQGILSTFLVRIPACYLLSKVPNASLFLVGSASPLATLFAIILLVGYLVHMYKSEQKETIRQLKEAAS